MDLRRLHNNLKFTFLSKHVVKGMSVLDVGCGRGGDIHKWNRLGCTVVGVDPCQESIKEAQERISKSRYKNITVMCGDITDVHNCMFDIVCYNFSLHYIYSNQYVFDKSIQSIIECVKPGGYFIGVVPDASKITKLPLVWMDPCGNTVERGPSINPNTKLLGQMILVNMKDGPYYANGGIPEPLCHKEFLFTALCEHFELIEWRPFHELNGHITDIYSTFVFKRK